MKQKLLTPSHNRWHTWKQKRKGKNDILCPYRTSENILLYISSKELHLKCFQIIMSITEKYMTETKIANWSTREENVDLLCIRTQNVWFSIYLKNRYYTESRFKTDFYTRDAYRLCLKNVSIKYFEMNNSVNAIFFEILKVNPYQWRKEKVYNDAICFTILIYKHK